VKILYYYIIGDWAENIYDDDGDEYILSHKIQYSELEFQEHCLNFLKDKILLEVDNIFDFIYKLANFLVNTYGYEIVDIPCECSLNVRDLYGKYTKNT
jgi:hypothetical protein